MGYDQTIKWGKKHPKGTRQPMVFSTGSGFWPSRAFIEDWQDYVNACNVIGTVPFACKDYYDATLRGCMMAGMDCRGQAEYTKLRAARAKQEKAEAFVLVNDPPRPSPALGEPTRPCRQKKLFSGMDCLPGQLDLFEDYP